MLMKTKFILIVATVLTVYGIETLDAFYNLMMDPITLQQYLPFTVLKLDKELFVGGGKYHKVLQQYLPFTVLKHL